MGRHAHRALSLAAVPLALSVACGRGAAPTRAAPHSAAPSPAPGAPTSRPVYRPVTFDDMDQEGTGEFDTNRLVAVLDAQRAAIGACSDARLAGQPDFHGTVLAAAVDVGIDHTTLSITGARPSDHELTMCVSSALAPGIEALRCEGGDVVFAIPVVFE